MSRRPKSGYFGDGYAIDGQYISAIIDVGTPTPRIRRYDREIEQFAGSERDGVMKINFPSMWPVIKSTGARCAGAGNRDGRDGDVRIQFRVGNTPRYPHLRPPLGAGTHGHPRRKRRIPSICFSWAQDPRRPRPRARAPVQ